MTVPGANRREFDQRISAHERQVGEDVASVRLLEQRCGEYRRVMRENAARFDEAGWALGAEAYVVQRDLAAVGEVEAYAARIALEQEELCGEAARKARADSEVEVERLRRERDSAPWG